METTDSIEVVVPVSTNAATPATEDPALEEAEDGSPAANTDANNSQQLRQRRTSSANNDNDTEDPDPHPKPQIKRQKSKRKRLKWLFSPGYNYGERPSHVQETVFMTMQMRKMRRRVHGRKIKSTLGCELCCLACFIILIFFLATFIVAEPAFAATTNTTTPFATTVASETNNFKVVTVSSESEPDETSLTVAVLLICLWALLAFIIITKSPFNHWMRMLKWMILYLPLIYLTLELAFYDEDGVAEESLLIVFIILEFLTFAGYLCFYLAYPLCLKQQCLWNFDFDLEGKVARIWKVGIVSDWTMTYSGINHHSIWHCKATHTCKYEGEFCEKTGLPQGLGRWLDDAWEGEMITGYWKQGQPVAPFSSWSYGTDDAVAAVRVAYFHATDDPFDKNEFHASNAESTPFCGVASVECSVSGSFYDHLPEATVIEGPYTTNITETPLDGNDGCYSDAIRQCIQDLDPVSSEAKKDADNDEGDVEGFPSIEIRTADRKGVQVMGHVYEPTGKSFANDVESVTVQVNRSASLSNSRTYQLSRQPAMRLSRQSLFMPKVPTDRKSLFGKLVLVDVEEEDEDWSDSDGEEKIEEEEKVEEEEKNKDDLDEESPGGRGPMGAPDEDSTLLMHAPSRNSKSSQNPGIATLSVQNWVPAKYKEALLFIPGYNSSTKYRLENFGQFLAMSKLSTRVYPFVYCWPGSVGPGYFEATKVSGTAKNFDNLHKLVASIRAAGIRTVHIMTHSMGAQTLLGALADEYDEKRGVLLGQSKTSECFQFDHAFATDDQNMEDSSDKLVCKTITMLNPDFPLEAFINRGFKTLRRICRTITVVGDRNDQALWWSSFLNGWAERRGYRHWAALRHEIVVEGKRSFRLQERVGRSIDSLHFPPVKKEKGSPKADSSRSAADKLVFKDRTSLIGDHPKILDEEPKKWLDMDVVDMTGLDTNIAGLRHTGFNLNGMLLKDLEELLRTGNRAMKRSTLVYRDGNMFSYAHAPAFVSL